MRLADDPEIAECVEALTGAEAFEWDRGNRTKSEVKHGVSVADVESIFASPVLLAGRMNGAGNHEPPRTLRARHAWNRFERAPSGYAWMAAGAPGAITARSPMPRFETKGSQVLPFSAAASFAANSC